MSTSDREQGFHAVATYQAAIAAVMCGRSDVSIDGLRARVAALPAADLRTPLAKAALLHARLLTAARTGALNDLDQLAAEAAAPARAPTGPPTLRTHELLGELWLKAGRPREAVAAYQRALELTPKRSAALLGLARASRRLAIDDRLYAHVSGWSRMKEDEALLADGKRVGRVRLNWHVTTIQRWLFRFRPGGHGGRCRRASARDGPSSTRRAAVADRA